MTTASTLPRLREAPAARGAPRSSSGFWWLTLAAAAGTYLLIVAGAVVRVTGSGLGCPDWPTCHGRIVPPLEAAALIEYTHRLLGAVVSTLIVAVPVAAALWRRERRLLVPAALLPLLLAVQIVLGAIVVWLELPPEFVLVHLMFAMLILGGMCWLVVQAGAQPRERVAPVETERHYPTLLRLTALVVFLLVFTGAYTRASGASWACIGFPGCTVPETAVRAAEAAGTRNLVDIHLLHRFAAYFTTVLVAAAAFETWRRRRGVPALRWAAGALVATLAAQITIGAVAVSFGLPTALRGAHVAGAAAVWASSVVLLALESRLRSALDERPFGKLRADWTNDEGGVRGDSSSVPSAGSGQALRRSSAVSASITTKARAYFSLTKPKVILLLEAPTLAAMLVAGPGWPSPLLVVATLLGGALAAGGAAAINAYLDRDIDALMGRRTQQRAIPSGIVSPGQALAFGLALAVASFAVLVAFANVLAAALAQVALLVYVFVYTRWLKRSTPSNIVIGGAAGAIPPLVGWAAVTGEVGPVAWLLFAIIFFWTPPHFWALALIIKQHYERASVPMLPVVRGDVETRRQIVYYTLQMISVTLLLFALRYTGVFYLGAALALGAVFLYFAARLWREATTAAASRLFHYSMLYLWLLCAALVVDRRLFA